jgi:elongation factor Ts
MEITADMVKELRLKTGAGIIDCRNALREADGDLAKAVDILREKGLAAALKKMGREAKEGAIEAYIHHDAKLGVMVELNCETDFVARTPEFKALARELCLQIAAESPQFIQREDVPAEVLEKEKEIYKKQALQEGKEEKVIEKIAESRVENFFRTSCLMEMPYVRDPQKTVGDLMKELIVKVGENVRVRRFVRFKLGEEI